jgi:CTP synthase (UTP-ammonia lyase)
VGVQLDGPVQPDGDERWIAIVGDRIAGFEPQDSIAGAIEDAAQVLGKRPPSVRWFPTDVVERDGKEVLAGAAAVWCAPGGPFRSMDGALEGIRWAREAGRPFLGTCAGFQHGVLEYARNVMGHQSAAHAEYRGAADGELFIEELLCSLVGETMEVDLVDSELVAIYGNAHPKERYYCRFGLSPAWRVPLHEAGLLVAGVDAADGDVRVLRLADHPYFVLTLFVPQTSSSPGHPHPLVTGLLRASL